MKLKIGLRKTTMKMLNLYLYKRKVIFILKRILIIILMLTLCIEPTLYVNAEEIESHMTEYNQSTKKIIIGYKYKTKTKIKKYKVKVKKKKYLGKFYITHYCPCAQCCGVGGGKITASGTVPKAGRTVGVNPNLIPYGTKLRIGGKDGYVAEDTGGGIGWKHIDMFCNTHQEALNAGVGYQKVYAITTTTKIKKKKIKYKVKVPIYAEQTSFIKGN